MKSIRGIEQFAYALPTAYLCYKAYQYNVIASVDDSS